jgi:deoxyadenosine/deoxycytidine kinase
MQRPIIISVEGNIGSGKTTMIDILEKRNKDPSIVFLKEPVDLWQTIKDKQGETILSKFYKDPKKYAFSFQVMAYSTRLSNLKNAIKSNPNATVFITERSLDADRQIFAKMLYNDNMIEEVDYRVYEMFYHSGEDISNLSGVIYIETDPEISYQRIWKRAREGEQTISLEYLHKCHNYHIDWSQ